MYILYLHGTAEVVCSFLALEAEAAGDTRGVLSSAAGSYLWWALPAAAADCACCSVQCAHRKHAPHAVITCSPQQITHAATAKSMCRAHLSTMHVLQCVSRAHLGRCVCAHAECTVALTSAAECMCCSGTHCARIIRMLHCAQLRSLEQ